MAFFRKADAKVRTFFEPPKLFRRNFRKSFSVEVRDLNFVSVFQYSSAFLSRKRVQNYCFTAYTPNLRNTFLQEKCNFARKSLILKKKCRTTQNQRQPQTKEATLYLNIIIIGLFDSHRFRSKCIHSCHRGLNNCGTSENGWHQSCHHPFSPCTIKNTDRGHFLTDRRPSSQTPRYFKQNAAAFKKNAAAFSANRRIADKSIRLTATR